MKGDPFFADIVKALTGRLDPDNFELCVADLLRDDYPALVPVPGGSDGGMDGAIPADGLPFPLICTTSNRVLENLTKSLRARIKDIGESGGPVILATSQALSAKRRRSLEVRADELGFTLRQVYDRTAIADRLYYKPHWCMSLLHLPGNPQPLSAIPRSRRPLLTVPLIAREEELAWLASTSGDRVIVGQPGSGKTCLMRELVRNDEALFLATTDPGEIIRGIRAQQPAAVVVDDAHADLDSLTTLRRLRTESGASFDILATSWPAEAESVASILSIPATQRMDLRLLTRDEIVSVVKATGFSGHDDFVREIVNQAEGRAGLAVTLVQMCRAGAARDVAIGDALVRLTKDGLEPIVGDGAVELLATFAAAGDAGLSIQDAADSLHLTPLDVRRKVAALAAAGVITEVDDRHLSVRPPSLRFALIREVFFAGAMSLDHAGLFQKIQNKATLVETLVGATLRGAPVPRHLIQEIVSGVRSSRAWVAYAALGEAESNWALAERADLLHQLAPTALEHAPHVVVPRLLQAAVADLRAPHSHPNHPMRALEDWAVDPRPFGSDLIKKRALLLLAVSEWFTAGGDSSVAVGALKVVFSPVIGWQDSDPGAGHTFTIHKGVVELEDLAKLRKMWVGGRALLQTILNPPWSELIDLARHWFYPGLFTHRPVAKDLSEGMHAFACEILDDIRSLAVARPGVLRELHELSQLVGHDDAKVAGDSTFDLLFPPRSRDSSADLHKAAARVLGVVDEWAQLPPADAAARLTEMEHEAAIAHIRWPRLTSYLCTLLAQRVVDPQSWARALFEVQCPLDLPQPFLQQLPNTRPTGWEDTLQLYLERPEKRGAALRPVMSVGELPPSLLGLLSSSASEHVELIEFICQEGVVPPDTLNHLLTHFSDAVAAAAAVGVWRTGNLDGRCDQDLWRRAILRSPNDDTYLEDVFKADSSLGLEWLLKRIDSHGAYLLTSRSSVAAAIINLTSAQREELIGKLPNSGGYDGVARSVIGGDLGLYQVLLNNASLARLHLAPLQSDHDDENDWPDAGWARKAAVALSAGYSPEDVIRAAALSGRSWWGEESGMWQGLADRFAAFCSNPDPRIQELGQLGQTWARERATRAKRAERAAAVRGD